MGHVQEAYSLEPENCLYKEYYPVLSRLIEDRDFLEKFEQSMEGEQVTKIDNIEIPIMN
jgi:hypothetical protein